MTERVLGPTGSPRRRWTLLLPLVVMIALGLFYVAGAQAVHDEVFELDGNVAVDAGGAQNIDWATLFNASGGEITPLPAGFDATSFDKDFENNGTTFITSDTTTFSTGSKDTLPISPGWQCNFDNNVNSKIDVMNAYAASYTDASGDEFLYFGLERNTNTGDANVAFWFLQDEVTCSSTGGSADFQGDHTDGDLLVVSEFSNGGTVSTINVYRWNGDDNTGSLGTTPVATGVDCRAPTTPAGDEACAAANLAPITTPWLTAAFKENPKVGHTLPTAQFFEGGVNLTESELGGKCFNTFIGDTRSSTSLTATLFDFSGGQLGACTSGIVTTPQTSVGATIPAGGIDIPTRASGNSIVVRDHADITVTGASAFGGTVTFFLCGPLALSTTSNCQTGGVQIGTPVTVTGSGGTASLNSANVTLTSIGRYCWRAVYSGDSGAGVPGSSDPTNATNLSECFKVNPITPTLATQASCSASPCVLGSTLSDTATLSGTASQPGTGGLGGAETIAPGSINPTTPGAAAGGSITWIAYGPNDCTTVAMASTSRTVSGDGTYPTNVQTAVSFTPTAVGLYTFVATYDGSSPNTLAPAAVACADQPSNEEVTVTGAASLATAQKWRPNDDATITSPAGTTLAGLVDFKLYNDGSCGSGGGTVQYQELDIDVTSGSGSANSRTVSTNNVNFLVTAANDAVAWSWQVSYDDNALEDPAVKCETTTPAFTLSD